MAERAIIAAFRALTPAWGAAPAWAATPENFTNFATRPLFVPPTANAASFGVPMVCVIIATSTSSRWPRRMNSGLPPRNSMVPAWRNSFLYSISTYSSAGTAISATRPDSASMTPGAWSPMAAASMAPIWAWWPHACAAPASGSACGWPGTMSESSSPMTAIVGPAPAPSSRAFTPVTAMPSSQAMPMPRRACAVSAAVLRSRKPVSGVSRMRFATLTALSAFRSISAQTAVFSSATDFATGTIPPGTCSRTRRRSGGTRADSIREGRGR